MQKIPVIFEDNNFLIIYKPSGIVVHPFDNSSEETLLDFLVSHSPSSFTFQNIFTLQNGTEINLGGIVHKLDRDTSGVMVIAKNEKVFNELKDQFRNHTTTKTYHALVEGIIDKDWLEQMMLNGGQ